MEARLVDVEVDARPGGNSAFRIIGVSAAAARGMEQRLTSGMRSCGLEPPAGDRTVNFAPAGLPKEGPPLDLALAGALLAAASIVPPDSPQRVLLHGEVALGGQVRPVPGALAAAEAARAAGLRVMACAEAVAPEAAAVRELRVHPLRTLHDLRALLAGEEAPVMEAPELASAAPLPNEPDLADVRGQAHARRALEIAAAGGHGLLFVGPPGTGKSLLARRMPSILPPLTLDEAVEVTRVHSAAGLLLGSRRDGRGLVARRPFRAPHHAISSAAMLGGGRLITPGEMSLAHRGVLFLDELPEFRRDVLESLRQPLEEGAIAVVRVHGRVTLPCRVAVIAAMNPCPCGWHGSRKRACSCSDGQVARYRARLSGPLVDRLDLHVEVPALAFDEIASAKPGEASAVVRRRVAAARSLQLKRARCLNASLPPARLREIARLDDGARSLLQHAVDRMGLSGRAHDRVLQVALTIGDLEGGDRRHGVRVTESHLAEALSHRALDRLTRPVAHAAVHGAQGGRP